MEVILEKYIIKCDKCGTKIIYSHKDCDYDERYHSYELRCPSCHNRYSTDQRTLFCTKYDDYKKRLERQDIQQSNAVKALIEFEHWFRSERFNSSERFNCFNADDLLTIEHKLDFLKEKYK